MEGEFIGQEVTSGSLSSYERIEGPRGVMKVDQLTLRYEEER